MVEDNKDLRKLYSLLLKDHDVLLFSNADGLCVNQRWRGIDVAVVDLMYKSARVNGFDLLFWLKEQCPQIKTVLVTGGYSGLDYDNLKTLADEVLIKPIDKAMLEAAICVS